MTIKVRIEASWTQSEQITKRLLDQFYVGQDLSNIEFVHSGDCDYIFYFGYETSADSPTCKQKYIFSMEPSWSGGFPRNRSNSNIIVYAQSKNPICYQENVIEFPTFMFYGAGGEGWTYDSVVNKEHSKTKNISCIISRMRNVNKFPTCLYDKRRALVTSIMASNVDVDVYGWPKELYPKSLDLPQKISGLSSYKFSVASENTAEDNYITEKFYDCIITDTIPIYFGAPNIKNIFPENGYFVIDDITDTDSVLQLLHHINQNADKLYSTMLPEVRKIKHRYFTEFNLLTKILELSNAS
jgi:hypothetical protein